MSDPKVLERFHRTLIEEIQTQRPEYLTGPFTVAEIYQNLVPYRSHRDRIGVEINGDYEDALLRLLAGEGGYLILDSEPALQELRAELEVPNPNTGLYREYAAVDVRLNQAYLDLSAAGVSETDDLAEELGAGASRGDLASSEGGDGALDSVEVVPPPAEVRGNGGQRAPDAPPAACRWCRAALPERDSVSYCPFCGTDIHLVPCPTCGEELDADWRFCISCGAEVSG